MATRWISESPSPGTGKPTGWTAAGWHRPVAMPLALRRALGMVLLAGCASTPRPALDCPAELEPLIDLATLDPAPLIELRYATADNFTGAPLPGYEVSRALLRPAAAAALDRVAERLLQNGLQLKVWDAYRPARASRAMVDWAERTGNEWVIEEGYVAPESGHNRGATIDLTLARAGSGEELPMGTAYDEFTEDAHTTNARGEILENRMLLLRAMEAEGWENYPLEWWHFSHTSNPPALDVPLACYP